MKSRRINRTAPLIILFLVLAVGLLLFGVDRHKAENQAAALPIPSVYPDSSLVKLLVASGFSPADDATEVPLAQNIVVSFNRDLNPATINDNNEFYIRRSGFVLKLAATITYDPATDKATLNPSSNLLPNTVYEATVTNKIESTLGFNLANPQTWSFKTISPPQVQSKNPAANATDVPVTQSVSVTFDKTMDWSTVTAASFYLQKLGGSVVSTSTIKSLDKKTATLTHAAPLTEGATYLVTLTTAVKAENGLSLPTTETWMFEAVANAPNVTTAVPADGSTGVPLDQTITATFDRDVDPTTVTSATFYIQESGGSPLPANVSYNAAGRTATLNPLADLEQNTTYEVRLTTAVEGTNGAPLAAPVVWSFTTVGDAPAVTAKIPANGASDVPVDQVVSATFDENIVATTLTSATFYLEESGGSPLPASVTYNGSTRTGNLDPVADLKAGATYEVTLTTAVQGENGLFLASPVVWTFTTAAEPEPEPEPEPGTTFSDVAGSPYATAIYTLALEGAVSGFEDGTFRPNSFVTRQQFAKMIVLTLKVPVNGSEICPFTDVQLQAGTDPFYPSKYVAVCAAQGITVGKTPTTFAPYDNITHQQLITMVARAAGLATTPVGYMAPFTAGQFSLDEHYQNALKAGAAGLLDGLVGMGPAYNFLAGSTRGECAQILYNLMQLLES